MGIGFSVTVATTALVGVAVGFIVGTNLNLLVSNFIGAIVGTNVGITVGANFKLLTLIFTGTKAFTLFVNIRLTKTNPSIVLVSFITYNIPPIANLVKKSDNQPMVIIKNSDQINGIRRSSQLAAKIIQHLESYLKPGVSTQAINDIAHKFIVDNQATSASLNYQGFPRSICTSINNVVCHGIPSKKEILRDGDIINIDVTTILNGYYGDTSVTYPIGKVSPEARKLIDCTRQSLNLAIKSLKPGKMLNQCVGQVIQNYVGQFGYSPVRDLGGHGVGIKFHEDPFVFHFQTTQSDVVLKPGMIFTIEPMINASLDWRVTLDSNDGWTIRTRDGSLSCQFEHTVLITPTGSEILTKV